MDLNSLPWKTVCCSEHETATVVVDDVEVSVQRSANKYAVLVVKDDCIVSRITDVSKDEAEAALADF